MTLRQTTGRYLLLGVVLGLAALTKASSLALTLLTALVVTVRAVRNRSEGPLEAWKEFVAGGLATLLPLLAISGWWYLRNVRLYGDPTGLNAFIQILGQREVPAGLAQLWRERYSFLAGYWGNFGGLNVPMPPWVYRILNAALVVAGLGVVIATVRSQLKMMKARGTDVDHPGSGAPARRSPRAIRSSARATDTGIWTLQFALCLFWGLGVLIPWAQWARVTWSSQGRLVFAALPVWSLLLALGLSAWLPRPFRVGSDVETPPLVILLALFLLGLSVAAPFVWIRPAYALPDHLSEAQIRTIPRRTTIDFGNTMRLLGYDLRTETTTPGGQVVVTLYWEAISPTQQDHTVFVHLLDEHELVIGQRDTFPGLGLLSTTWLTPGRRWSDRYVIPVPTTAYAPNQAVIEIGLFNTETGDRLTVVDASGDPQGDNVRFGHIRIKAQRGDIPNPIAVNFGDRMLLTGYDLTRRAVQPGETITLTLHWQPLQVMDKNYTVSAQLIDGSQRKAAQHDSWPLDGAAPTAAWEPGETVTDTIPLAVFPDAAAGPYNLRIAVYVHQEGEIKHLPVTPPGGRMQSNHVTLTPVRVTP